MNVPRIIRELKESAYCHQLKDTLPPQPVERSASNGLERDLEDLKKNVRMRQKFVVGKTLGAPKNVNLIPRVKTLNSPNGGGPHITPRLLERKCGILYPG